MSKEVSRVVNLYNWFFSLYTDTTSYTSSITPDELAEIASIRALVVSQYQADLDQKDREYQAALAEERKRRESEQEQAQQRHAELQQQIEQLMALLGISANPQGSGLQDEPDGNSSNVPSDNTRALQTNIYPSLPEESPWKKVNSRATPKKRKPKNHNSNHFQQNHSQEQYQEIAMDVNSSDDVATS